MKGIVLAGGTGSRLYPLTLAVSKQLLPIYDKPLIYYPLSTLMLANIREVLVITRPSDHNLFKALLGDGSQWGLSLKYEIQERPGGIAEAFQIGERFLDGDEVCLILGDNIFYGTGLGRNLSAIRSVQGAHIFGYHVSNPQDYGVLQLDDSGRVIDIEEKPQWPKSNWAIPGLYFYNNDVCNVAKNIVPSARGEKEITDINLYFLKKGDLDLTLLQRGTVWLDAGTFDTMYSATTFVKVLQERLGLEIGNPEVIAKTIFGNLPTKEMYEN